MLVHSSSVTEARPRLRSTNCCCSFGRSARCLTSSASSRASLEKGRQMDTKTDIKHIRTPSSSPPRIHVLIHLFINLVRLLIIRFVCRSSEEPVLVVWILKLFRVHFRFFSSSCLSLATKSIRLLQKCGVGMNARDRLSGGTFSSGTDIRTGRETRCT